MVNTGFVQPVTVRSVAELRVAFATADPQEVEDEKEILSYDEIARYIRLELGGIQNHTIVLANDPSSCDVIFDLGSSHLVRFDPNCRVFAVNIDTDDIGYFSFDVSYLGSGAGINVRTAKEVAEYARGFLEAYEPTKDVELQADDWSKTTERLLDRIQLLLDDKDALRADLLKVYQDLDVANSKISQLEASVAFLQEERLHAGREDRRDRLMAICMLIATLLSPIATWTTEDGDPAPTNKCGEVVQAANDSVVACGGSEINITNNYTIQPDDAPVTSTTSSSTVTTHPPPTLPASR